MEAIAAPRTPEGVSQENPGGTYPNTRCQGNCAYKRLTPHFLEKRRSVSLLGARTKSDTGGRGEKPKGLEITLVKELGKMVP